MSYWAKNQKDTKQKKVAKDKPLIFFCRNQWRKYMYLTRTVHHVCMWWLLVLLGSISKSGAEKTRQCDVCTEELDAAG